MSELIGWIIVLGLAVAIACIFMLSRQLEKHTRTTAEMMLRSNEMLLAQLDQLTDPSLQTPEPVAGVVLERRSADRRSPLAHRSGNPVEFERRGSPGRRLEDMPAF